MGNDWFHEYFINELKAIGRKPTSNMQHEVVDSLPSSGNEHTIYFVKNDSSSSNNHYDEYVWISSSSTFEKIGSTQIDGSTTQPDWNQNDATQPDYIKNRPFYTGDPVETVFVEETTLTFEEDDGGIYVGRFESTFSPIVGETYKVSWDGTVYECACVESNRLLGIGNLSIAGSGPDTGEPFFIAVENSSRFAIGTLDAASSHTISISVIVTPVVKIDPKYLDQPDWDQNDVTASSYIKNRPFYTGYTEEKTLVKESPVNFKESSGHYLGTLRPTFSPIVGETYKVSWDGTVYESVCIDLREFPVIGNLSIMGAGSDTGEPFLIEVGKRLITIHTLDTASSHVISVSGRTTQVVKINEKYLPDFIATKSDVEAAQSTANNAVSYAFYQQLTDEQKEQARTNIGIDISSFSPLKPAGESYLTFSSPNRFTLAVKNATKRWDGTLEYFTSDGTWTTWNANGILSAIPYYSEYVLYLRGTGNTIITGNISGSYWVLTGTDIKCIGNIENLLDYATVESGAHPTLADHCYYCLFYGCTSLTQAPALPATTLANHCYDSMFRGCTSLTHVPALLATTLADYCCNQMFYGCTSLTQAPVLPATTLADYCYNQMFQGCTSLTQAPALPATTLADHCCYYMFSGCTSLTHAPAHALPATTLANYCYSSMFRDCTSLTHAPALPATTLAPDCYSSMFSGCTSLAQAPALPATTLADHCYYYMFNGCTSLTKAPTLPATTLADYCYRHMFYGCASLTQVPALPATTLANDCYNSMFQGCAGLKLSTTLTNEYTQEYRIPSSGDGTTAPAALSNMFASTGGTFTGTPEINTTYYLSSDNMIVRETDIATLNGYVGYMINTAVPTDDHINELINTAVPTDDHINELINSALSAIGIAEEGAY